jgi:uncharacterized membrane protein
MQHTLYVLFTWVHILAAAAWAGGMMFLTFALVPALRALDDRLLVVSLLQSTGQRFKIIGWIALTTLVLTGFGNIWARGFMTLLNSADFWRVGFGRTLGIKLLLVGITLAISGLHDFLVGPRAVAVMRKNPDAPAAKRLRLLASWMGRANFLLAMAIILCGVMLVRGAL